MHMALFDDFIDLIDGPNGADVDDVWTAAPAADLALVHVDAPGEVLYADIVMSPGDVDYLELCMAHPDPLSMAHTFRFECFDLAGDGGHLVDLNGDGVPDHTCWGTPVERVAGYVRADGTEVADYYRTVADGQAWNNLSASRS